MRKINTGGRNTELHCLGTSPGAGDITEEVKAGKKQRGGGLQQVDRSCLATLYPVLLRVSWKNRILRQWNRFSREAVDALSLEVFEARMNGGPSTLV